MAVLEFPNPPLTDGTVALRPWRTADVPQRFAAFSDPLCLRYSWPHPEPFTAEHLRDRAAADEQARLRGERLAFAVVDPHDLGTVLGGAALYDVDLAQLRARIGYWLGADSRGRGAATGTVRLLAAWGFHDLGLARLELTCEPTNSSSRRVAERCGFTFEGVLRSHQRFRRGRRDTAVFGLLPGELR
ncbi:MULTISPECIES: GNAT family N-acetyltransferase [unclassified Saccharopolyspora]|uniref:GNAT family N-acetyltransferase n=1 Tax=unclassified Saccharopolyspora TaxID=2646250 RepID=UPI001CD4812D|nr:MULTISPECIES: GNAT family protein [unclassified Saccharopolyspora]MCA1184921.1 GNAT family N-acetyltransferase [Saccharopolyspora sp. 6T]MCA1190642.1 GNAT family N-acetyltransferase [Saccharopolyspora sp. 6V]MCA1229109.1 GNAT family N-acetyltransferase [Saccharopolyspora sp. 6M]MCA1279913.1 GNAT family N-acetyltransferase [Saccharopolyspora sp. 7B]